MTVVPSSGSPPFPFPCSDDVVLGVATAGPAPSAAAAPPPELFLSAAPAFVLLCDSGSTIAAAAPPAAPAASASLPPKGAKGVWGAGVGVVATGPDASARGGASVAGLVAVLPPSPRGGGRVMGRPSSSSTLLMLALLAMEAKLPLLRCRPEMPNPHSITCLVSESAGWICAVQRGGGGEREEEKKKKKKERGRREKEEEEEEEEGF